MNTKRTPDLDDLLPDQREALIWFKETRGTNWKQKLNDAWLTGRDERLPTPYNYLLRQVRNQKGPQWLSKLKD